MHCKWKHLHVKQRHVDLDKSRAHSSSALRQAFWTAYFSAMEQVAFDFETPVYVASGLLTYMDERGADRVQYWA